MLSATVKPAELQLGKPKTFNGSYEMAISWMHSIQFYLAVNETSYNNDVKKIAFALLYMTEGSALTWADTFCENAINGTAVTLRTWDDFLKKFQQTFKHQDTAGNAISWLSIHHMIKKNRKFSPSLESYILTFQSNTTRAGIMDYNILISFFTAGIPTLLMKQIMSLNTVSDKIKDWYSKVTHFQNQWDHAEQIAQQSGRSTQTFQSFSSFSRTVKDPNAMDIDMVKIPKRLTPEEQEQCTKKGLCFWCCKSGHMASACPAFSDPPKKPCVQHAWKEEKLPNLKEIEDNDEEEGVAQVHFGLDKDFWMGDSLQCRALPL